MSLCVYDLLVCRFCRNQTCIPEGHLHRETYTRCRIDTINSPDDGHITVRNIQPNLHTRRSSTQSDIYQMSHWYNNPPDDEHMAARNMHRIEINIQEKIVRQIGYLQGSYQNARSTKHKIRDNIYRSDNLKFHSVCLSCLVARKTFSNYLRRPASWSSGQSLWLLIMRSRVRFPALPWEFSLKGKIPTVIMVWVD